jgi:hypothetical protein
LHYWEYKAKGRIVVDENEVDQNQVMKLNREKNQYKLKFSNATDSMAASIKGDNFFCFLPVE